MEYIISFDQLKSLIEGLFDSFLLELFNNGHKEEINSHVIIHWPYIWFEACDRVTKYEMVKNYQPEFPSLPTCMGSPMASTSNNSSTPPLQIEKLTSYSMEEC